MIGRERSSYVSKDVPAGPGSTMTQDGRDIDFIKNCFLELVGELHPQVVRGINPEEVKEPGDTPIHEYSWNVGITGSAPNWYNNLEDDALVVQLIFHTTRSRYAVREVAANLSQVPPYQKTTAEAIMDWFDLYKPVVETTGKVLEATGINSPGKVLSAVAGMKMNSVPVDKFRWYVKTFSLVEATGIEWHIPRLMLVYTGNRICGSLGITLLDCGKAVFEGNCEPDKLLLEMRAFLRLKGNQERFLIPLDNTSPVLYLQPLQRA